MDRSRLSIVVFVASAALVGGCSEGGREFKVAERPPSWAQAKRAETPGQPAPTVNAWQPQATPNVQQGAAPPTNPAPPPAPVVPTFNTESYDAIVETSFVTAREYPLSTFSIDVDTASYALVRRFLKQGLLPPAGAVRIEELINYFPYHHAKPSGDAPFSVDVELADCPWNATHRLARIGLKGRDVHYKERPASNLVFLIDVSGSMSDANKLPLVKLGLKMLLERLDASDRVAIVVYAGESGLLLPSTSAANRSAITAAIDGLSANGSTNAGDGIQLAYRVATQNFIKGGANRIILCTDGDFNVGITDQSQLVQLIEAEAKSGVFLTVLGFGMGNYKDSTIEKLADKGNGNYAYIDTDREAKKVLVDQLSGTLVTIAKDVKIQVDFNPARAAAYRLIGYENRLLQPGDFKNDAKDAGEIGAGHTVTAFYEIVPAGQAIPGADVDPSKYQAHAGLSEAAAGHELFTVRLRYKDPDGSVSKPLQVPVVDARKPFDAASEDYRFAASVAEFGMLLRDSPYRGDASFDGVLQMAAGSIGPDRGGYRAEFLDLAKAARNIKQPQREVATVGGIPWWGRDREPAPQILPAPAPQLAAPYAAGSVSPPNDAKESQLFTAEHLVRILALCLLALLLFGPDWWRRRQEHSCEGWQEPYSA
jgi:Ca-activated chloride channel family protein